MLTQDAKRLRNLVVEIQENPVFKPTPFDEVVEPVVSEKAEPVAEIVQNMVPVLDMENMTYAELLEMSKKMEKKLPRGVSKKRLIEILKS